jgi:alkylated DNA repair dioxygenase AlkB
MSIDQFGLFGADPGIPAGFRYRPGVITPAQEAQLLEDITPLPFKEFEFQGYLGKRRTVSFGWRYDYDSRTLLEAQDMAPFLLELRKTAAAFADVKPESLQQALVTEYQPGAPIGWHRDKAMYGDVIGISLISSCQFRLRRKLGEKWERYSLVAEPRSAYLMRGPSRTEWEHSIPPVDRLRYSITFRNFKEEKASGSG